MAHSILYALLFVIIVQYICYCSFCIAASVKDVNSIRMPSKMYFILFIFLTKQKKNLRKKLKRIIRATTLVASRAKYAYVNNEDKNNSIRIELSQTNNRKYNESKNALKKVIVTEKNVEGKNFKNPAKYKK